jgi:hypothetical protein
MGIEVKGGIDGQKLAGELQRTVEQTLGIAVSDEVTQMIIRTRNGLDVDGQPFQQYSEEYAIYKEKKGRNPSPPDLTISGAMLGSITSTVKNLGSDIEATVYFGDAYEAEKARANLKYRRFFGFSLEQLDRIRDKLAKAIKG